MEEKRYKDLKKEGHHRGGRYKGREDAPHRGAKTFRRRRAIDFLERMQLKRSTIKQQLDKPEFQSIHPILVGELKAIDMVIDEFVQLFEIHANEVTDTLSNNEESENLAKDSKKSLENDEEGTELS